MQGTNNNKQTRKKDFLQEEQTQKTIMDKL